MKYYLVLAAIASLITFPRLVNPTAMEIKEELLDLRSNIVSAYPQDLEITLKEGKLTTNREEPLILPMPNETDTSIEFEELENFLVVDVDGTLDDLENYSTLILVNQSNILTKSNNKIEVYPLKDVPDGVLNAQSLKDIVAKTDPFFEFIPYLIMLMAFVGTVFYYFGFRLVYLLFVALALMVAGQLRGLNLNFKKYYQIGLHAISLPLLIEVVTDLLNFSLTYPYWFFVLNILIGILAIVSFEKTNVDGNE